MSPVADSRDSTRECAEPKKIAAITVQRELDFVSYRERAVTKVMLASRIRMSPLSNIFPDNLVPEFAWTLAPHRPGHEAHSKKPPPCKQPDQGYRWNWNRIESAVFGAYRLSGS